MLAVVRALEQGSWDGPVARAASRLWARAASRSLVRPLRRPQGVVLVTIGGATLGGSGKTPLAIACASELSRAGLRVALVGHAYRARPGGARVVRREDAVADVGDEALVAREALERLQVPVVVARRRQQALDLACTLADCVVVDGVVQASPRASLALLAVDPARPFGAGAVPPCGDLRAPAETLRAFTDVVVPVGADSIDAVAISRGVVLAGDAQRQLAWADLTGLRIGVFVALARPDRLLSGLARRGVVPCSVVEVGDHGRQVPRELRAPVPVDLWIASAKCALHAPLSRSAPLAVIDHQIALSPEISTRLRRVATRAA